MNKLKFFTVAVVIIFGCTLFARTAQAQTAKGPEREIAFTVTPHSGKNGYEVKITFKYRFQLCVDKISLDGYRTKHEPQAYWYNGKRYSILDLRQLNSKNNTDLKFAPADQHLYPNLDFSADIYAYRQQSKGAVTLGEPEFYAKGSWFWVNFTANWGGCLGDYGGKYEGYETQMSAARKNRIGNLFLKNINPKDSPTRDYAIENALGGKTQRPLETFKDVKQVTETLKSEAKSAAAERENAQKQTKNGKTQSVDDLLNSTGRAEKQQDLDALLGSTGYAKQEVSSRNLTQADAAAANVTSFSDRTRLAEAQKLYQKALADQPDNTHVANQLQRVEWILKQAPEGMVFVEGNGTIRNFYIGTYEVTKKQWDETMEKKWYNENLCDNCPVVDVSWKMAQDFIQKLNAKTGKKFRLPTEDEWEWAARGGKASRGYTYSGSNNADEVAWYSVKSVHSVGTKKPNELEIYDMSGNVSEWVNNKDTGEYIYYNGSYDNDISNMVVTKRRSTECSDCSWEIGFRLAMDVE